MEQLDIEYLTKIDRVTVLLHPLRLQIMGLAIEGTSATDAARRLGLPRQMVNYHVLALEKAGLLVRVGEVRRRNMVERRVQSSARAYLISPDILGPLSGARRRAPDPTSPTGLLALAARVQSDLGQGSVDSPGAAHLPVLSSASKILFADDSARAGFIKALGESVGHAIRSFTSRPAEATPGFPYGLILGLYPLPRSNAPPPEGDSR